MNPLVAKIVVCAIALNEELYVDEWINHNLRIGFEHIFLYDNSPSNTLRELEQKYNGTVSVIHFPGRAMQIAAYDDMLKRYKRHNMWVAVIDLDEFIIPKKHQCVRDLLNEYAPHGGGLALNWVMFGSSGREDYSPEPVTQRFTWRREKVFDLVKSISYLPHVERLGIHHSVFSAGSVNRDTNGAVVPSPTNPGGPEDVACIHHYFTKSKGEWLKKRARGRAGNGATRPESEFGLNDYHDFQDFSLAQYNYSSSCWNDGDIEYDWAAFDQAASSSYGSTWVSMLWVLLLVV